MSTPMERTSEGLEIAPGKVVQTVEEFVAFASEPGGRQICEQLLYSGALERWLRRQGEEQLAVLVSEIRLHERNRQEGFAHFEKVILETPPVHITTHPHQLDFEGVPNGETRTLEAEVINMGYSSLHARIRAEPAKLLSVSPSEGSGNGFSIKVTLSPKDLPVGHAVSGQVIIEDPRGVFHMPVTAEIVPPPLTLPSGAKIYRLKEVGSVAAAHWKEMVAALKDGRLAAWLHSYGQNDLAELATHIAKTQREGDLALQAFLEKAKLIDPPVPLIAYSWTKQPKPEIAEMDRAIVYGSRSYFHPPIQIRGVFQKDTVTVRLSVQNQGVGFLYGKVSADPPWLRVNTRTISGNQQTIVGLIRTDELEARRDYRAEVVLETNGGTVTVPIILYLLPYWLKVVLLSLKAAAVVVLASLLGWGGFWLIEQIVGGSLYVTSNPTNLRIYVNDTFMGRSGRVIEHIRPGHRLVRASLGGYEDWQGFIAIRARELTTHYVSLTPIPPAQKRYRRAKRLLLQGKLNAALSQCREALRYDPDYEDVHLLIGIIWFRQGKIKDAIERFQIVLQIAPDHALAHAWLARAYMHVDQVDKAIAVLEEALKLHPRDPFIIRELSRLYVKVGRLKDALAMLEEALRRYPKDVNLHLIMVDVCLKAKQIERAFAHAAKAVELAPKNAICWTALSRCYLARRLFAHAEGAAEHAVALSPNSPYPRWVCGYVFEARGKRDDAIRRFREVLFIDPKHRLSRLHLALSYERAGQIEMAVKHLVILSEAKNVGALAHSHLIRLHLLAGDFEQARLELSRLKRRFPKDSRVRLTEALVERAQGNWKRAKRVLEEIVKSRPLFTAATLELSDILRQQAEWEGMKEKREEKLKQAVELLKPVLAVQPDKAEAHYKFALLQQAMGKKQETVSHLLAAKYLKRDFFDARRHLADAYLKQNQPAKALNAVQDFQKLVPHDLAAMHAVCSLALKKQVSSPKVAEKAIEQAVGEVRQRWQALQKVTALLAATRQSLSDGKKAQAIRALQKAMQIAHQPVFSEELMLQLTFAHEALRKGDKGKVQTALQKASKSASTPPLSSQEVSILLSMGEMALKVERADLAEAAFAHVIAAAPQKPEGYSAAARLYRAQGERSRALKLLQKAQSYLDRPLVHLVWAEVYAAGGEEERALTHCREALSLTDTNADVLRKAAQILERLRSPEMAISAYLQAAKADRDDFDSKLKAAMLLFDSGDAQRAHALLQEVIENAPGSEWEQKARELLRQWMRG